MFVEEVSDSVVEIFVLSVVEEFSDVELETELVS